MDKACENSSRKKRFPSKIYNWCYDYEPESETYDYEVFSHWIKNLVVTVNDKVKRCKAAADIYYKSVYHFGQAHFETFYLPGAAFHAPRNLVILVLSWEYWIMKSPFSLLKPCLCSARCNI